MHRCIVCDNISNNTKVNRPVVLYHRFPKNEHIKIKWLKVFGIDHCHDGQRICSDHFLKEHYKPGKRRFLLYNAIPQPYVRNGFPSKKLAYFDESDYIESEFFREEHIENAAINNFKSPGRSSRLTRNNEDMLDHTLGSFLKSLAPDALPVSINEVPALSTCEDQFICPIDNKASEQSSLEKTKNVQDNTDDTSMKIEDFTRDIHGFIFKMSKEVVLPSLYWKSEHLNAQNATGFYQRDANGVTVKKVIFYNNLVPTIQIYGNKYEYKMPITTMKELDDLLEKIDSIEKCYGRGGFVFEQCIGCFENSLLIMCMGCQGLVNNQDLQRMKAKIDAKNNSMESFKNRVSLMEILIPKIRHLFFEKL